MLSDGTYEEIPQGEEIYLYGINEPTDAKAPESIVPFDKVGEEITLDEFVKQFTDAELMDFVGGHGPTGVCNTGCFGGLQRLSVPAVPTADGPAGLRLDTATGIPTTAWPCATLLACSWNPELAFEVGVGGGAEIRENNLGVWLSPALNIHRDPMCGRNFEYYSEDPLIAGKFASAVTRGVQSQKVAVSIKHFACNNKEANRFASDSRLSERALREIYLKGFEICVKEADPWTVMSSYNLINGQHSGRHRDSGGGGSAADAEKGTQVGSLPALAAGGTAAFAAFSNRKQPESAAPAGSGDDSRHPTGSYRRLRGNSGFSG